MTTTWIIYGLLTGLVFTILFIRITSNKKENKYINRKLFDHKKSLERKQLEDELHNKADQKIADWIIE